MGRRSRRNPNRVSELQRSLALQLKAMKVEPWKAEYRFHTTRRWRFDFAWPEKMVAVEVQGGVFSGGRHVRPQGFTNDCEKFSIAGSMGWRVLPVTGEQVKSGQAAFWVKEALAA